MIERITIDLTTTASTTDTLPMPTSFAQMPSLPQHPPRASRVAFAAMLVIALTFPVLASARTPLPTQELDMAQAAVSRAETADADQYAPDALLRARNALTQAQALLAARKSADATGLAQLAAAEADYAYARSRESSLQGELARRRGEIAELRQRLGIEGAP